MKFLLDNLALFAVAISSGALLIWPLFRKGGAASLSPLEATQLINHRNAIVVDVRDEKDFATGSLAGARNLPFATIATRAAELVRFKSRPVLIVCATGQRSAQALAAFKTQGFDEAYSLAGGVAAWKQAGIPLVQPGRDTSRVRDVPRKARNDRAGRGRRDAAAPPTLATTSASVPAVDTAALADSAPADAAPATGVIKELS